jgi:hypothetical protein
MKTETPRTDSELLSSDCTYNCGHSFMLMSTGQEVAFGNDGVVVLAEFARRLERENIQLRESLKGYETSAGRRLDTLAAA